MSKKTKKWYRRTHDFAPYTRADGKAVSDEFDAIQASFEKIPAMREDGLGFAESPIIPDPTEDNHPVPFHLLKTAERSVYAAKESVESLAQQVADNNNTTEQNTHSAIQANQQAAQSQQLASQSATQAAEANRQAQQAKTQAQSQAQTATSASSSAQQSATQASESENLAQKWAANPVDEQVQGGKFSAYHYAAKARLSAEKAENIADGRKDWSDIDNVPISTDVNDNSKTNLASAFIVKTAYDKAVEAKELAESKQSPADTLAGYGIANFKIEQSTGNANDYKTDGNYYFTSGQNLPDNSAWHIEVVSGGQADAVRQIARKANDTKIKTRFFNGSNWTYWKDTGGDGVPLGAVISFPKDIANPQGFLLADGSTFSQQTYPDLYRTLGNKNKLPNLKRSDVGMLAYFPTDNIPDGWLPCNHSSGSAHGIERDKYPELYDYLVPKYGTFNSGGKTYAYLPHPEDRFIRSAHGSLAVGQKQDDAIRNIKGSFWSEYSGTKYSLDTHGEGAFAQKINTGSYTSFQGKGGGTGCGIQFDASKVVPTANENRPKSIAFKLCIKAKNSLDDVRFWIKAFGSVENAGTLDAGRLAQDLQLLRSKNEQLENSISQNNTQINQAELKIKEVEDRIAQSRAESHILWSGNVTQDASRTFNFSQSILNKILVFYLQVSGSNTLQSNANVHTASIFVDSRLMSVSGKKYAQAAIYASGWKNIQIELMSDKSIKLIDASSMYLKQITVI